MAIRTVRFHVLNYPVDELPHSYGDDIDQSSVGQHASALQGLYESAVDDNLEDRLPQAPDYVRKTSVVCPAV